jgi:hypothetical protein
MELRKLDKDRGNYVTVLIKDRGTKILSYVANIKNNKMMFTI